MWQRRDKRSRGRGLKKVLHYGHDKVPNFFQTKYIMQSLTNIFHGISIYFLCLKQCGSILGTEGHIIFFTRESSGKSFTQHTPRRKVWEIMSKLYLTSTISLFLPNFSPGNKHNFEKETQIYRVSQCVCNNVSPF